MDATMEATVVDPRPVGPEMVLEATEAALNDARTKAPEARLEQLFAEIGPHVIYDNWMPFLFGKKGCYQQVAGLFKRVREQMLGIEQVERTEPVPRHPLPPETAAELMRGAAQHKLFLTALETAIVSDLEAGKSEVLRYSEAKTAAEVEKHERLTKIAEKESADHLAAAAAFEAERVEAISRIDELTNRVEELTALLAAAEVKFGSLQNVVNRLTDQLRIESERADAARSKVDVTSQLNENLRDQVSTASGRVFQAEAEAARLAGLHTEIKEQLATARGQIDILTQQLHMQSARADRGHAKGGRQHCHPYPSRAICSRRKGKSE
jgi:predicted  nucleic acid-binding Zn-ribbon protein